MRSNQRSMEAAALHFCLEASIEVVLSSIAFVLTKRFFLWPNVLCIKAFLHHFLAIVMVSVAFNGL